MQELVLEAEVVAGHVFVVDAALLQLVEMSCYNLGLETVEMQIAGMCACRPQKRAAPQAARLKLKRVQLRLAPRGAAGKLRYRQDGQRPPGAPLN